MIASCVTKKKHFVPQLLTCLDVIFLMPSEIVVIQYFNSYYSEVLRQWHCYVFYKEQCHRQLPLSFYLSFCLYRRLGFWLQCRGSTSKDETKRRSNRQQICFPVKQFCQVNRSNFCCLFVRGWCLLRCLLKYASKKCIFETTIMLRWMWHICWFWKKFREP